MSLALRKQRLFWQIFPSYVAITLLAMLAVAWYGSASIRSFYVERTAHWLLSQARLLEQPVLEGITQNPATLDHWAKQQGQNADIRITLILPSGQVLADSHQDPATMKNHLYRPEVQAALTNTKGNAVRYSNTLQLRMMYVAIPLWHQGKRVAVLRTAIPISYVDSVLTMIMERMVWGSLLIVALAAAVSWMATRRISRPLEAIRQGALRFAHGNLDERLTVYPIKEIGDLAEALNEMASQLARLEQTRKEFVANVSHELRTPITVIQGSVETLASGAMEHPEDAQRFMKAITRQTERLNNIITDLLLLSRIEAERGRTELTLEEGHLWPVFDAAILDAEHSALQKNISLSVNCPQDLKAAINGPLLELAITNLITNAIKYSPPGTQISLSAFETDAEVVISVVDQGPGIEGKHLSRLFERFYRVDKARSRKDGGTGLGLSIVKHIALAHQGYTSVKSTLEQGSTFSLHLPKPSLRLKAKGLLA